MSPALVRDAAPCETPPDHQLWSAAALLLGLAAVALAAWSLDERDIGGVSVWAKPLKFCAATILHLATLAVIAGRLSAERRASPLLRVIVGATVVAALFELGWITLQAARGEPSHFNVATPFAAVMYSLMGVLAVVLILNAALLGAAAWTDRGARLGPATRLGVALGLILGFGLTLVVAGYLGGNGGHFVGEPAPGDLGLPILGWSTTTGDLRGAHFFALHIMQVAPLAGLAADRWRAPIILAPLAAGAMTAATVWSFVQALRGAPLIAF